MGTYSIKKGRDLRLKGAAQKRVVEIAPPKHAAVQPADFRGLHFRLAVKVDDQVKAGTAVLVDKNHPEIQVASPISGKVAAINRGPKRALVSVVIESNGRRESESFQKFSLDQVQKLSSAEARQVLIKGRLWNVLRQRPFSRVARPADTPKALFVHAMNTEPLAADIDFVLDQKEQDFHAGLKILQKIVNAPVHLCTGAGVRSKALTGAQGVQWHTFSGPHPAGNVSTHIHLVDPIRKGDIVWYIEAQDVVRVAHLFLEGTYPAQRVVAVTGEGAANHQHYVRTVIGAPISAFLGGHIVQGARCLSGSVLAAAEAGAEGFLGYYDSQITVIPAGGQRKVLGWLSLGTGKCTFSKTYASAFLPKKEASLDSDMHGSPRAMVLNDIYDQYVPLDIMTYFLLKAVLAKNIEEAEHLGILECDEEDFALCSFACPSKTDVGGIVRQGLDLIEKEG